MDISIVGSTHIDSSYIIELSGDRIIYLKNNFKFNIDLNKNDYIKIIYRNSINNKNLCNFIQLEHDRDHYPILLNPSWNSYITNQEVYSENIFFDLKNYFFQPIDNIDKINQLNCLCADFTRPYYFPKLQISIADNYSFTFTNWIGNNQIWVSRSNKSSACLLLGKNTCFLTCLLDLPSECGGIKYEFFSKYDHDTPYDELQRIDCFSLRPDFKTLTPINFPMISDPSCLIDINKLTQQIQINTEYSDV